MSEGPPSSTDDLITAFIQADAEEKLESVGEELLLRSGTAFTVYDAVHFVEVVLPSAPLKNSLCITYTLRILQNLILEENIRSAVNPSHHFQSFIELILPLQGVTDTDVIALNLSLISILLSFQLRIVNAGLILTNLNFILFNSLHRELLREGWRLLYWFLRSPENQRIASKYIQFINCLDQSDIELLAFKEEENNSTSALDWIYRCIELLACMESCSEGDVNNELNPVKGDAAVVLYWHLSSACSSSVSALLSLEESMSWLSALDAILAYSKPSIRSTIELILEEFIEKKDLISKIFDICMECCLRVDVSILTAASSVVQFIIRGAEIKALFCHLLAVNKLVLEVAELLAEESWLKALARYQLEEVSLLVGALLEASGDEQDSRMVSFLAHAKRIISMPM